MPEVFEHGYALLIGVNENTVPGWGLPDVANDIRELEGVLTDPQRCAYLQDNVKTVMAKDATLDGIMAGLTWLQECIDKDANGTAIIYYSGHGGRKKPPASSDFFFVSCTGEFIPATAVATAIDKLRPQRLLVVLDCCHAGGMGLKEPPPFDEYVNSAASPLLLMREEGVTFGPGEKGLETLAQGRGRAVLSSSTGEQPSYIRRDRLMSIFTYHLIEALTGHAQLQQGVAEVLVSDVMSHIYRQVPQSARRDWNADQVPDYQVSGNFPIALLGGTGPGKSQRAPDPLEVIQGMGPVTSSLPEITATSDIQLADWEKLLLQHVYEGYKEVLVEKEFGGGYSGTRVLLTLPIKTDGRRVARKVTKLGSADELREEHDNYKKYAGPDLPFCIAQVGEYYPYAGQAALVYTFVGGGALGQAVTLEEYYRTHTSQEINQVLTDLLDKHLGSIWYGQTQPLNCFFKVEYGRHIVEHELERIVLEIFSPQMSVDGKSIQLSGAPETFPNPLLEYRRVLDQTLEGRKSYVHGDLNLRNVLVDESGVGRLIDFAKVTERHNLYDFIKLETHIRTWGLAHASGAFSLVEYIAFEEALSVASLTRKSGTLPDNEYLKKAYEVIWAIREIARKYMGPSNFEKEYFPALFLYCLAALKYRPLNGAAATQMIFTTACVLGQYIFRITTLATAQVVVHVKKDLRDFDPAEQKNFIFALSRVLNIDPKQIRVLGIASGSVMVTLEMPEESAQLLMTLYLTGQSVLETLRIARVEILKTAGTHDAQPVSARPNVPNLPPPETAVRSLPNARRGIPQELYSSLRHVLKTCDEFSTHAQLFAIFSTQELKPFQQGLSEASSVSARVNATIAYLVDKRRDDGRNALVLFLRILSHGYDQADARHPQLLELANQIEPLL